MSNYFVRNLETGKVELHFDRATYQALPEDKKREIKIAFLWARSVNAWVSRTTRNNWRAESIAKELDLENRGETGEKLTFAEQHERKVERAEDRAERMENRAEKAADEAHARFNSDNIKTLRDMQGEPVKLGHHSAKRHLRLIEKADKDMEKGCEAYRKSQHYEQRAEAARDTASEKELTDAGFLMRRIRENEAEERRLLRRKEEAKAKDNPEWLDRLERLLEEVHDKLTFYRERLEACGGLKYGKHNIKPGDFVLVRGRWEEVVRCNPTTVAVPNICYLTSESQRKYALKYVWGEVKDHRPITSEPIHVS